MTDAAVPDTPGDGRSAGQLLREARLAKGLTVAGLAAQLRVSVARLEALEADHTDELHGAAYTRSLAIAVCRALGIEAAPVLLRLPVPDDSVLGAVGPGLNTPFKAGPPGSGGGVTDWLARPLVWGPALFLVAAALVWWWPQGGAMPGVTTVAVTPLPPSPVAAPTPATAAPADPSSTTQAGSPATVSSVETVHSAPPDAAAAALDSSRPLQIRTVAESWVEVLDARGAVLLSRTLQPGEQVGLVGALPLQLRIGNASSTLVQWRGLPVELSTHTRDNVARLEVR
jgi:cytoskeleton protein RodZ